MEQMRKEHKKEPEGVFKVPIEFMGQDEILKGFKEMQMFFKEYKDRMQRMEAAILKPDTLVHEKEWLTKARIKKLLGIGEEKFQELLIAGLDVASSDDMAYTRYSKAQLLEILRNPSLVPWARGY